MQKVSYRKYIVFIAIPIIAVAVVLYHVTSDNVSEHFKQHTALAHTSVNSTNSLFQQHLGTLRKDVGFFVDNYKEEIQGLAKNPQGHKLNHELKLLVDKHFDNAVTYTLADSEGEVILSNINGMVGIGCQENIRLFAIDSEQSDAQLRIHHTHNIAHFDIMYELNAKNGQLLIFFITFKPDILSSYLANFQLPGHQLMLIKKDSNYAIELTKLGSKMKIDRDTLLSTSEQDRVLVAEDVPSTLWQLIDFVDKEIEDQANDIIFRDLSIIFASFVLGALLALIIFMKHEK